MKYWKPLSIFLAGLLAGAAIVYGINRLAEQRAAFRRQSFYDAVLRSQQTAFVTGSTRATVETRLNKENLPFTQGWDSNGGVDEVLIGHEPPPFYCGDWRIYLVFHFREQGVNDLNRHPEMTDTLEKIELDSRGDSCA